MPSRNNIIAPEDYGAVGKNKTFAQRGDSQAEIDSGFPGIGADPSWTIDRAAWAMALTKTAKHKIIVPKSENYYINGLIPFDGCQPYVVGNQNKMKGVGAGSWAFFGRKNKPTSRSEMEAMFSATNCTITGLHFEGTGNQVGLDLNSVRWADIEKNEFNNVGTGIKADFAMYANIRANIVSGAQNGIIVGLAIPGDNESSSNLIRVIQNECHTVSNIAFANYFAYEAKFDQNIIEGNGNCQVGFDGRMDGKTTGKEMDLGTWHLEQTGSAQIAWFRLRLRDQIVRLRLPNVHDATNGILIDADSSAGGMIILQDLCWFDEAKWFKTKGTTFKFHYCKAIGNSNKNTIWYDTNGYTAPKEGPANAEGYHSYELVLKQ